MSSLRSDVRQQGASLLERDAVASLAIELAERGWLPDALVRRGVRRFALNWLRKQEAEATTCEEFVHVLRKQPIAVAVEKPNEQHYELPAEFFRLVLGTRLKYSACYWPRGVATLDDAEEAMLALSAVRAGIEDGMDILDLGCGWGAFSLWLAERYPRCRVLAMSNSASQGQYIAGEAKRRGLVNVQTMTTDVNELVLQRRFDRIVSVEMFEHMRNYASLLARIAGWLAKDGKLFVHVFCHRRHAYLYSTEGRSNWMARMFFTGGTMPSYDLLPQFHEHLRMEERWWMDGIHYQRTLEAWRGKLDGEHERILAIFRDVYGPSQARRWLARWRLFFLSCAEVFGYANGREWGVGHYRFASS